MKSFKETFYLIETRIRNLKGIIQTSNYCINNPEFEQYKKYHQDNVIKNQKELDALILQDSQLRDFIIKDK